MTETTNDPNLLKTHVWLERQQHEMIPEEYQAHKKELSSQFGLVFQGEILKGPFIPLVSTLRQSCHSMFCETRRGQSFGAMFGASAAQRDPSKQFKNPIESPD